MKKNEVKTIAYDLLAGAMTESEKNWSWFEFSSYTLGVLQFAERLIADVEDADSDDAISRSDALKAMYNLCDKSLGEYAENPHIDAIADAINSL